MTADSVLRTSFEFDENNMLILAKSKASGIRLKSSAKHDTSITGAYEFTA